MGIFKRNFMFHYLLIAIQALTLCGSIAFSLEFILGLVAMFNVDKLISKFTVSPAPPAIWWASFFITMNVSF